MVLFGILSIIIGSILGIYSIYLMRVKNDIVFPSILIVFVHFAMILGIFLITKNIGLGFVAMIFYNILFVSEIIIYVIRNKNTSEKIERLKSDVDEEIKFWESVFLENHKFVDDEECFHHLLRVNKLVERARELNLFEIVNPLLNLIVKNKAYFKDYRISRISENANIDRNSWWLYVDKI